MLYFPGLNSFGLLVPRRGDQAAFGRSLRSQRRSGPRLYHSCTAAAPVSERDEDPSDRSLRAVTNDVSQPPHSGPVSGLLVDPRRPDAMLPIADDDDRAAERDRV